MSVHEEIREQQKKLKGQGIKAHLQYFWDYYKIHTVVALAAIIFIVVLVKDVTNNKPYAFYALMLNSYSSNAEEVLESEFTEYAGIDTTTNSCFIDTSVTYNTEIIDEVTIATSQKIMANLSAAELDSMAADQNTFAYYAHQDIFMDLRTIYDESFLNKYADKLFYVDRGLVDYIASDAYQDFLMNGSYDKDNKYAVMAADIYATGQYPDTPVNEMDNPVPVGIIIDDSSVITDNNLYQGTTPVVGIIANTTRLDNAKLFIDYLLK